MLTSSSSSSWSRVRETISAMIRVAASRWASSRPQRSKGVRPWWARRARSSGVMITHSDDPARW
ncbi:MAG: hypothetical protein M5U14_07800 [Acidimicrobiia bacterium]|nr:hypothetical protein [Acidimicrobiia bacterium]